MLTIGEDKTSEEAFATAVKYISYRPRTEQETRERLLKRYSNHIVEVVIARCHDNNFLNDQKFSELEVYNLLFLLLKNPTFCPLAKDI